MAIAHPSFRDGPRHKLSTNLPGTEWSFPSAHQSGGDRQSSVSASSREPRVVHSRIAKSTSDPSRRLCLWGLHAASQFLPRILLRDPQPCTSFLLAGNVLTLSVFPL